MTRSTWLPVVAGFAIFVVAWKVVVVVTALPPFILPAPETVAERFIGAWVDGTIWPHFATTMIEIGLGFVVGAGLALAVGYALARSVLFERLASPYLVAAQAIPILVLAPLLVLWFGSGLLSKVVICALIVFFPMVITAVLGLRSLDRDVLDAARTEGAGSWGLLWHIEFPLALPSVLAGLRASSAPRL